MRRTLDRCWLCRVCCACRPGPAKQPKATVSQPAPPDLLLDGGRKLTFERSFSLEREVKPKRSFWTRVVDVIAGEPDFHFLVNPYSITTDSHGRVIVTDPGANGIHIFDFTEKKYKFLSRKDTGRDPMLTPQCVAVDAQDNIYVTDSLSGKIFVFDPKGKYRRAIGSLKGGEGFFKRPTGIAVDSVAQRIYITDTLRNKILRDGHAGQRSGNDRKNRDRRGRIQLSDRVAAERFGPVRGRCHELSSPSPGPVRQLSLCHRKNWRRRRIDVPPQRDRLRFRRASLRRRRPVGYGAGVRPAKAASCTTSGSAEPEPENFSCRPDCRSTTTIASTSWIPSITASKCSITTRRRNRPTGEVSEVDPGLSLCSRFWRKAWPMRSRRPADVMGMHNLSPASGASVYSQGSLGCTFCHAPHSGLGGVSPLWNQTLSKATYTPYSSTTYVEQGNTQPTLGVTSSLCLSCHDGTVAVGQSAAYGTLPVTGSMNSVDSFGTNLGGTHPFSLVLPMKDASNLVASLVSQGKTADPTGAVKLINGNIECTSCHNPHVQGTDKIAQNFLVRDSSAARCALPVTIPTG